MNRIAQGLTLILLGVAALTATVPTNMYLNWVKPGFGPFLIAAGLVMVLLGVLVVVAELRGEDHALDEEEAAPEAVQAPERSNPTVGVHTADENQGHDGHDHSRAPRVAWLLLLPVVVVFVIAPPALGSYTVENTGGSSAPPPPDDRGPGAFRDALADAEPGETVSLAIQEFVMRAWIDEDRELADRKVELTGFAVPDEEGGGWYLARLQMACCAADAVVNKVLLVTDRTAPEADSWWTVRGTWVEPEGELDDVEHHKFEVDDIEGVDDPPDPYE